MANLSSEFFKKNTSVATAKYQLRLGSSAMVAKVWQALDGLGISNVSILKVSHSQTRTAIRPRCASRRCGTPSQNAATLAEAIGQTIGKCFYVYDSNNDVMPVFYDNMAVMRSAKASMPPRPPPGGAARFQDHQVAVQRAGEIRSRIGSDSHGCLSSRLIRVEREILRYVPSGP
ncbi:MAG: hypothetical protein ACLVK4_09490 [Alistipes shahii]|uniref:hypothetical protein n=1 Tax=Alistipes shahii TaxID=328814 RepID=UPI00399C4F48